MEKLLEDVSVLLKLNTFEKSELTNSAIVKDTVSSTLEQLLSMDRDDLLDAIRSIPLNHGFGEDLVNAGLIECIFH